MILDHRGKEIVQAKPPRMQINARFDNAQTTDQSARNWWASDYLSAKAANSFAVRRTLRIRSRYEVSNNPRLWGVAVNHATDLIDKGPTLQCLRSNDAENRQIEILWQDWCAEVNFTGKLTTAVLARTIDGAGPLIYKTVNDMEHPVKLWPCDVEDDQFTSPMPQKPEEWMTDGVELHPVTGEAKSYSVLKYHPGDYWFGNNFNPLAAEKIPARNVSYLYLKYRPGQVRGLPIFTPSLDLFTELRAFRKSTLDAAHKAATYTSVIESQAPPGYDDDDAADDENYEFRRMSIDRGMQVVLPAGWKMNQFRSEHPNATYTEFVQFGIMEAIRPLAYPFHRAMGTSKDANFSSMKGDDTNYKNCLSIERVNEINRVLVEKAFRLFIEEAARAGLMPPGIREARDIPHEWHWPGFESLDPLVDAQSDQLRLAAGLDTFKDFWARRGRDHRDMFKQISAEQKEIERLEITLGSPLKQTVTERDTDEDGTPQKEPKKKKKKEDDDTEAALPNRIQAFDESKHPRDKDGKWGTGGGSGDGATHQRARSRIGRLVQRIKDVPRAVRQKATSFVRKTYTKLESKYGKNGARMVLAGMILLAPTPIPGSSLLPMALAEGVKRLRKKLNLAEALSIMAAADGEDLDAETLAELIREHFDEFYEEHGEEPPELDDDELIDVCEELIEEANEAKEEADDKEGEAEAERHTELMAALSRPTEINVAMPAPGETRSLRFVRGADGRMSEYTETKTA